jgi:hypothetical protein
MAESTSSILPNLDEVGEQSSTTAQAESKSDKSKLPKTRYWLNVGVVRNGKLLSLPMGIPLDGLKAKAIPTISLKDVSEEQATRRVDFRDLREEEAKLWEAFSKMFHGLKPGEERDVNFTCRVRMTENTEETPSNGTSGHVNAYAGEYKF